MHFFSLFCFFWFFCQQKRLHKNNTLDISKLSHKVSWIHRCSWYANNQSLSWMSWLDWAWKGLQTHDLLVLWIWILFCLLKKYERGRRRMWRLLKRLWGCPTTMLWKIITKHMSNLYFCFSHWKIYILNPCKMTDLEF